MSKYTTGEIAKLCGVSVRTVQYYDDRGILIPSELSDGGRRLYTENDLKKMRIICFLREVDLPINSISALFNSEDPEKIISVLLEQHEMTVREELAECRSKLELIEGIKRELKVLDKFSVESISDIAYIMNKKRKLAKLRWIILLTGSPVTLLQWSSIVLWIASGIWYLFALWALVAISWGTWVSKYYFDHVNYICPECHEVFKPRIKEAFFAYHTPKMRRLTCPKCGRKGLCIEVFAEKEKNKNG